MITIRDALRLFRRLRLRESRPDDGAAGRVPFSKTTSVSAAHLSTEPSMEQLERAMFYSTVLACIGDQATECRFQEKDGLFEVLVTVESTTYQCVPIGRASAIQEVMELAGLPDSPIEGPRQIHFFLRIESHVVEVHGRFDPSQVVLRFLNTAAASSDAGRMVQEWAELQKLLDEDPGADSPVPNTPRPPRLGA